MYSYLPMRHLDVQVLALALPLMKMSLGRAVYAWRHRAGTEEHAATLFFSLNLQIFMHGAPE